MELITFDSTSFRRSIVANKRPEVSFSKSDGRVFFNVRACEVMALAEGSRVVFVTDTEKKYWAVRVTDVETGFELAKRRPTDKGLCFISRGLVKEATGHFNNSKTFRVQIVSEPTDGMFEFIYHSINKF